MYRFYRRSDAFDPEIFSVGAAAVLEEYPRDIVDFVTDVRTGMPSRMKYPPEVKDIRDACNELVEGRKRDHDRQILLRRQFADREAYERELAARAKHPTQKQLERKLGRSLGKPIRPLSAPELWIRWIDQRQNKGITLHPDAKAILEAAGYDVNGPDDQQPKSA